MPLAFGELKANGTIAGIKMGENATEALAVYIEELGVRFAEQAGVVHRRTVFQILTRLIRLCPVQTGRLRGSWTTFMQAMGFEGYAKFMQAPALNGSTLKAGEKAKPYSDAEVVAGRAQGAYVDAFLNTSITSNVVYAARVDARQGYLTNALIWGAQKYDSNFEAFLKATSLKEDVAGVPTESDDGQGGS